MLDQWQLELLGGAAPIKKSFPDWGFDDLKRERVSQDADTCTWVMDGVPYDSAAPLKYGDKIKIYRPDGTIHFAGFMLDPAREGRPDSERLTFTCKGPWYYLQKQPYQQTWSMAATPQSPVALIEDFVSDVILNVDHNGYLNTSQQIAAILNYGLTIFGPVYQVGALDCTVNVPLRDLKDTTCADAIREELRLTPDAVTYFDYATDPPTLHVRRWITLAPVNYDLSKDQTRESFSIRSRDDLLIPSCVIRFLQRNEIDGKSYLTRFFDVAPPGATGQEFGTMTATVPLKGSQETTARATINVIPFLGNDPASPDFLTWLFARMPALNNPLQFKNIRPPANTVVANPYDGDPTVFYPNEIIQGQAPSWLPFQVITVRVQFQVVYDYYDLAGNKLLSDFTDTISLDCLTTTAPLGVNTFSILSTLDPAEPVPIGLAAYLYTAFGTLQFEGTLNTIERDVTASIGMGNKLNIVGGRPEWATMSSPIQSISEDITNGRTTIQFGPPKHIGLAQLLDWMRALRPLGRRIKAVSEMTQGIDASGENLELPKLAAATNALAAATLIGSGAEWRKASDAQAPYTRTKTDPADPLVVANPEKLGVEIYNPPGQTRANLSHSVLQALDESSKDAQGNVNKGIVLKIADCVDSKGNPHKLTIKEMPVCDSSGNQTGFCLVLISEVYQLQ